MENKVKELNKQGIASRLEFLQSLEKIGKSSSPVISYREILQLCKKSKIRKVNVKTLKELGLISQIKRGVYQVKLFCSNPAMAALLLNISREQAKTKIKVDIPKVLEERNSIVNRIEPEKCLNYEEEFTISEKEFENDIVTAPELEKEEISKKLVPNLSRFQKIINCIKKLFK